jgi:Leucine-rich repeat (LRR) protein
LVSLQLCAQLRDEGIVHLAALHNLEVLDLWTTAIGDESLLIISENFPKLKELGVSATRITDAGLEHLVNLQDLSALHLNETQITHKGLAVLPNLHSLTSLGVQGTGITDADLDTLAKCVKLTTLWLDRTKVTATGVAKLQAALPNCKIEVSPEIQKELDTLQQKP